MFFKVLISSIIFLAIAMAGLGIRILIKSHGKFPETHVSRNPEMKKRGISCAQGTDTACHSSDGFPGCSCSGRQRE